MLATLGFFILPEIGMMTIERLVYLHQELIMCFSQRYLLILDSLGSIKCNATLNSVLNCANNIEVSFYLLFIDNIDLFNLKSQILSGIGYTFG